MEDYLKKVSEQGQTVNNLFNTLGVKVEYVDAERCVLRMAVKPGILQGAQMVSGGVLATLADEAMAHCVIGGLKPGQTTATIEMNIRYLRGAKDGELVATAKIVRRGRSVVVAEAQVCNGDDTLLVTAGASFWVG